MPSVSKPLREALPSRFVLPADPGSSFDSLAGAGAGGRGAERGIHGGRRLAADDAAAGSTEVK